jgi:hypothetical protein
LDTIKKQHHVLGQLVARLEKGISMNGYTLLARKITLGRFREEQNFELLYRNEKREDYLLRAKVFHGRPPDYFPWVELFDIKEPLCAGSTRTCYFDSSLEDAILRMFSEYLGPGARLFVEYYTDRETREQLQMDLPAVLSRLGYKMFKLGFTWFKDWYFPEGYLEGNQKLQAEKPLDTRAKKRHTRIIIDEIECFSSRAKKMPTRTAHIERALERREAIISMLDN